MIVSLRQLGLHRETLAKKKNKKKKQNKARCQWLTPVILATGRQRSGGSRFKVSLSK
jgi:hypothetical protein